MAFFFWEAFSWGNTILSKLISAPGLTWAKSLPYFFSNISGLHFDSKSVETQRINQQEVWILVLIWISHTPLGDFITLNVSSTALSFPFTSTSPCALINVYYCHRSPEGKILTVPRSTVRTFSPQQFILGFQALRCRSNPQTDVQGSAFSRWFDQGGQGERKL